MSLEVTTVRQLAEDVGIPAEKLLAQLQEALSQDNESIQLNKKKIGLNYSINPEQKQKLLNYLQTTKGLNKEAVAPKKITLRRRKKINLVTKDNKDLVVTIKKKRTYRQREVKEETTEKAELPSENSQVEQKETPVVAKDEKNKLLKSAQEQTNDVLTENNPVEVVVESEKEKKKKLVVETEAKLAAIDKEKIVPKRDQKDNESEQDQLKKKKKRVIKNNIQDPVDLTGKTLTDFVEEEEVPITLFDKIEEGETLSLNKKKKTKNKAHVFLKPNVNKKRVIDLPTMIIVNELAKRMAIKTRQVMTVLNELGVEVKANQSIDQETAVLVVEQLGHEVKLEDEHLLEKKIKAQIKDSQSNAEPRMPVVTIMGHVDHGKTSLLDKIRKSQITEGEAGGITQHIGAYKVEVNERQITFLDTPGHAAFTAMRARGANCTDIVVLVVAADDGVMPQTIEAITHTKAANVPIIVAINKIDKPEADIERIRSELSQHGVISEEWGGDYIFVPVSAKSGEGLDVLLESILLQAEVQELKAPKKGYAQGVVLESKLDKSRGAVSTLLVQAGTLKQGDIVISGTSYGRVRSMRDEKGFIHKAVEPSTPIEILGMSGTLNAGDEFIVVSSDRQARDLIGTRQVNQQELSGKKQVVTNLDDYFNQVQSVKKQSLNIILKTDVHGTLEALIDALNRISTDEITINIANGAVGGITESDINFAITTQAIIIGFNVRAGTAAKILAEKEGVEIKYFNIIYDLIDTIKAAATGLLPPEIKENIIGLAEVRDVFHSSRYGAIAGCMVVEGIIKRKANIRVLRDNVVIYEGELESLRRFKEDVQELRVGTECGIGVKNYNDIREKDQIEVFEKIEIERKI